MFAVDLFVGCVADAIDLVVGNLAVNPMNLRATVAHHAGVRLRDRLQLLRVKRAGAGISRSITYLGVDHNLLTARNSNTFTCFAKNQHRRFDSFASIPHSSYGKDLRFEAR